MKNIKQLEAIVVKAVQCKLPKRIILFENKQQKKETDAFLKKLGSSGVTSPTYPNSEPEIKVDMISYGGFTFDIIETDFEPNE